jgi:hypothetical protein
MQLPDKQEQPGKKDDNNQDRETHPMLSSPDARRAAMLKEMDLIQDVIKRMANTSAVIKGWTITIISLIFATKTDMNTIPFMLIPIILFWFLDAYFLQHERLYRRLYAWVIQYRLNDDSDLFSLNTARFERAGDSIVSTMVSITLAIFYGGTAMLVILSYSAFLFLKCVCK